MHPLITHLTTVFREAADPERAVGAAAYMKNNFEFFGIPAPLRQSIVREALREQGLPEAADMAMIVRKLWSLPQREFQYAAMDISQRMVRKVDEHSIVWHEECIVQKSWWDTVDYLAARIVGPHFVRFPEQRLKTVHRWIGADNMWLNRTAIIFQLGYKANTDLRLLEQAILPHRGSKEFFLRKAIGWALRQYSYTDADYVQRFVERVELHPLSVREALKGIRRRQEHESER